MIKKMFPLYMFGSRERKGKKLFMYLLFVWFVKEEKCVFFYLYTLIKWTSE